MRGDGWVKLVADWIDRSLGDDADLTPLWPGPVLADAVAAAHAAGVRVTAHTFATESLDDLLDAGVDCLEHATGATPEHIDRIAAAGIPVTATLLQIAQFPAIADQGARFPRFAARMRAMGERRYEHVRNLHEAGVPVLVGTDAGGRSGTAGSPTRLSSSSPPGSPHPTSSPRRAGARARGWACPRSRRGRAPTSSSTPPTRACRSRRCAHRRRSCCAACSSSDRANTWRKPVARVPRVLSMCSTTRRGAA